MPSPATDRRLGFSGELKAMELRASPPSSLIGIGAIFMITTSRVH